MQTQTECLQNLSRLFTQVDIFFSGEFAGRVFVRFTHTNFSTKLYTGDFEKVLLLLWTAESPTLPQVLQEGWAFKIGEIEEMCLDFRK
jgi:hypothetical protein